MTVIQFLKLLTLKTFECRPIDTLPPIEKILEIVVYNQIVEGNYILSTHQSGSKKKHLFKQTLKVICITGYTIS